MDRHLRGQGCVPRSAVWSFLSAPAAKPRRAGEGRGGGDEAVGQGTVPSFARNENRAVPFGTRPTVLASAFQLRFGCEFYGKRLRFSPYRRRFGRCVLARVGGRNVADRGVCDAAAVASGYVVFIEHGGSSCLLQLAERISARRRSKRYNVVDFLGDEKELRMSQVEWYYARTTSRWARFPRRS